MTLFENLSAVPGGYSDPIFR